MPSKLASSLLEVVFAHMGLQHWLKRRKHKGPKGRPKLRLVSMLLRLLTVAAWHSVVGAVTYVHEQARACTVPRKPGHARPQDDN